VTKTIILSYKYFIFLVKYCNKYCSLETNFEDSVGSTFVYTAIIEELIVLTIVFFHKKVSS
jgi:hypothetical protein